MRLATRDDGTPDGELLVVSDDGKQALPVPGWPNLLAAIADWHRAEHHLAVAAAKLGRGDEEPLDEEGLRAPLPRTWQWLDGSAFQAHADLMQVAFGTVRIEHDTTGFMRFGDRCRMRAQTADGEAIFGAIEQTVGEARHRRKN